MIRTDLKTLESWVQFFSLNIPFNLSIKNNGFKNEKNRIIHHKIYIQF